VKEIFIDWSTFLHYSERDFKIPVTISSGESEEKINGKEINGKNFKKRKEKIKRKDK
jgi:hypothetical protein